MAQATEQNREGMLFLALTLFLPTAIVVTNFVIGTLTPITWSPEDDLTLIDLVWRLAQGQHLGTDFHDPRGFGLFQVAAMVWHEVGPHYYVLRVAAALFELAIVFCAYVVATRRLRHVAGLAAFFCITVAFAASAPSNYGRSADFGMALIYDRLLVSGLLVLFVQSFANNLGLRQERIYIDLFFAAIFVEHTFFDKSIWLGHWSGDRGWRVFCSRRPYSRSGRLFADTGVPRRHDSDRFYYHGNQPLPCHPRVSAGCSGQNGVLIRLWMLFGSRHEWQFLGWSG